MSTLHKLDLTEALQVRIIPQPPQRIILSWDIGKTTPYPLAFNVYRSGIESGEFEKLNVQPVTGFFYNDDGLKPLSKLFHVVYKLEILFPFTEETQFSRPIPLASNPRLARTFFVARRMDEKYGIEYQAHSGIELVIFKQRQWGPTCTDCVNPVTGAPTKASCIDCFGTAIKKGFWEPYETLGKFEPLIKPQVLQDPMNFKEDITTQAYFRAFPIVTTGDIIVEKCQNIRWYIDRVQLVEHGRYPVKQVAEIRQIDRKSILYKLELE